MLATLDLSAHMAMVVDKRVVTVTSLYALTAMKAGGCLLAMRMVMVESVMTARDLSITLTIWCMWIQALYVRRVCRNRGRINRPRSARLQQLWWRLV